MSCGSPWRAPSIDVVVPLQRAVGHVVKVILRADDSNGTIGDLARELSDLHAQVCDARVADPVKLAAWMVRFSCEDQDFFEVDPVRYAVALGEPGLAAYRQAIARRDGDQSFAVRWARERLAVPDGDAQAIITLLGADLSTPHQFSRVCEAKPTRGADCGTRGQQGRRSLNPRTGRLNQLERFRARPAVKAVPNGPNIGARVSPAGPSARVPRCN
jgi:hypothetical protein